MINPELDRAQARIEAITTKWHRLMSMGWMTIRHTYNPNFNDDSPFMVATTQADWEYRAAVIDWHLPRVAGLNDETLEAVVVHEFVHCLTAPIETGLKESQSQLAEFAVESLALAILSVYGNSDGRRS